MLDFLGLEEEALRVLWSCIIMGIALGIETGALAGASKKIEFNNNAKATTGEIVLLVFCILLGVVGMAAMIGNYPIYKRILDSRKKQFSAQILALSDTIIDK